MRNVPPTELEAPSYSGLRVIEIADDPAGEMLGKLFAQHGADVVKIEPPAGGASRHAGPFAHGIDDVDHSLQYWFYNTNKRSVILDLSTAGGVSVARELVGAADVLISSLRPPVLRHLGIDLFELEAALPRLVLVSITPFGLSGPWSDYKTSDLVALALGGVLNSCGYDDHSIPPIRPGGEHGYQMAASYAHIGALMALIQRENSGDGQLVDVSIHDAVAVSSELANPYWFYPRALVQRQTCRHAQPTPTQPTLFQCADDRYICATIIASDRRAWKTFVRWLAEKDLALDLDGPQYDKLRYRQEHFGHIQDLFECFFLLMTSEEAFHEGQSRGLPIGPLNAPEDLFIDRHLLERAFFDVVDHSDVPPAIYPSSPFVFSAIAPVATVRAPLLGEHSEAILCELSAVDEEAASR